MASGGRLRGPAPGYHIPGMAPARRLDDSRVEDGKPPGSGGEGRSPMTVSSRCFSSSVSARRQRVLTLVAALVVSLLASLLLAGSAVAAFRIQGKTSQRLRLSFQVTDSFSGVRRFVIQSHSRCTSGATLNTSWRRLGTIPLDINSVDFRWSDHARGTLTMVFPDYSASSGRTLTFTVATTSTGHLPDNPDRIHGTWSARTTVTDPATGQVIDSCTTGRVTWKAHLV
jgi:hypothetical protein